MRDPKRKKREFEYKTSRSRSIDYHYKIAILKMRQAMQIPYIKFKHFVAVLLLLLMTVFAAREAVVRASRRYRGILIDTWLTMAASCLVVGGMVTQIVVGVDPWYEPQYVIPLLGMILGNSLTGISLCLDRFMDHLDLRSAEVELRIAFGASRGEALTTTRSSCTRTSASSAMRAAASARARCCCSRASATTPSSCWSRAASRTRSFSAPGWPRPGRSF